MPLSLRFLFTARISSSLDFAAQIPACPRHHPYEPAKIFAQNACLCRQLVSFCRYRFFRNIPAIVTLLLQSET